MAKRKTLDDRLALIQELLDKNMLKPSTELLVKPCDSGGFYIVGGGWMSESDLFDYADSEGLTVTICHGEGDPRDWKPDNIIRLEVK